MRAILALALMGAACAWAQPPGAPPAKPSSPCADCGVVRTVRMITKESTPNAAESKPSGLVAEVPFGGGKPKVGSSTKLGKDAPVVSRTWEVAVRLDDGKFRVVVLDADPQLHEGDRVRVTQGRIERVPQ